jgi:hypothetical protein
MNDDLVIEDDREDYEPEEESAFEEANRIHRAEETQAIINQQRNRDE